MTGPVQYIPKQLVEVSVMYYDMWGPTAQDVKDWITGLLETSFAPETVTINDNGYNMIEIYIGEDFLFRVESGQYVYLDEDGFHAASKGAFELLYKEKPPAA